ncbi:MAG TPA: cytochrome c oxidase subunit II [Flavipsychrobacter sp.]|nr:cytochrome c oxidase subunit II [Flavipsychrobacter sp.]
MSGFLTIALIALVFIIIYQIAKASEYAAVLRGKEKVERQTNRTIAWLFLFSFILGMWGIYECHLYLMDKMLPVSASDHGVRYDSMYRITTIITGIVFFITQALLFFFAFRYQSTEKRTAFYFPHSNKLELLWTTVPAIAMAALVAIGLRAWFSMTSAAPANSQVVEIVGKQFNWIIRYPGADNTLGKRDFRKINDANNVLGLDWNDKANMDDVIAENGEMHLIVNRPVKLIIGSRDVIHDVGLPHFRMKMDAVPGIITTIWFTPTITTAEMKQKTGNPNFVYEISCDQMCGVGHYAMRGTVIVETEAEHKAWLAKQKSYYATMNTSTPEIPADSTPQKADTTKAITMN